jgi:hypothetical protein
MGGYGSGRCRGHIPRPYIDDRISIDIRDWHQHKILKPDARFHWWSFSTNGSCALIRVTVILNGIRVDVAVDQGTSVVIRKGSLICLTHTRCHYGGSRPWFQCPRCERRSARLYFSAHHWICRICTGCRYRTQSESRLTRSIRKARKIRSRLGASPNLTEKIETRPKGMHTRTFERLNQAAISAELTVVREALRWSGCDSSYLAWCLSNSSRESPEGEIQ